MYEQVYVFASFVPKSHNFAAKHVWKPNRAIQQN